MAGGPAIANPDDYNPVYTWTTYPERLQRAGVSWQVFANDEVGDGGGADGFVGDYPAVAIVSGLERRPKRVPITPGSHRIVADPIANAHGWYDITVELDGDEDFRQRFAAHLENGQNSVTG
ncbi:MAG: hypothetical protein ABI301_05800 [Jatrophihabitantaceae bacterium]